MVSIPTMDCGDGRRRADNGCGKPAVAKTAAYTILAADTGTTFTNTGAAGSVTFTLPSPKSGMYFTFVKTVNNQNIVVTAPTAATMNGLTQGVTITDSTTEYGNVTLETDGTVWFVVSQLGTWTVS